MSMEVTIVCDGCSAIMAAARTAAIARKEIRDSGRWPGARVRINGHARDLCGPCANQEWSNAFRQDAAPSPSEPR